MSFVHLRNYSEYTIPAGMVKVDALVAQAAALGMQAVALTDRGTLAGAIEFYNACKKAGSESVSASRTVHRFEFRGRDLEDIDPL